MTKIDIISGFLGAGKTTLIKKLIKEQLHKEKVVLIENEFGEIGIDGGFLQDAGIEVKEMNSGCICCSLVGDFSEALKKVLVEYTPDRVIIEPSGVGKLSDVIVAVQAIQKEVEIEINSLVAVADANKCKMYMKNFGEFFNNQIESATTIVLSRTQNMSEDKLNACVQELKHHNKTANIITTPWDTLEAKEIIAVMEKTITIEDIINEDNVCPTCGHHHKYGEEHRAHNPNACGCRDDQVSGSACSCQEEKHEHHHEGCGCGEKHEHHHEGCGCGEKHEHHHEGCGCGEKHEHHHEGCGCGEKHEHHHEGCGCGEKHEHHHEGCGCGGHHAEDVFTSWGCETPRKYTKTQLECILSTLSTSDQFGTILRAKGILQAETEWLYFDLVPGEYEIRTGSATYTGRFCVIGADLMIDALEELFKV